MRHVGTAARVREKVLEGRPVAETTGRPRTEVDLDEAERFLRLYHTERPDAGDFHERWTQVRCEVARTGTYTHTAGELRHGARVAWRNSARCIGRLYWNSLRVRDERALRTPRDIHASLVDHLRSATNGGTIRPTVTVLPALRPDGSGTRIRNEQLIRYAGWRRPDGSRAGDPRYAAFTTMARRLGWAGGTGGDFDVLPLVIDVPGYRTHVAEVPPEAILEVPITHPELPWFADLRLRWHAVPVICNMLLSVGGVRYPAPFNGWYMGTEIGARNLADTDRYDMLPSIARRLGMDLRRERDLWRDRALVELNRAVLHSFTRAGVTITDHHTESRRFLMHLDREERAGRVVPAVWSWIVPPMSGAATPVFHRYYDESDLLPNYVPDPRTVASGGPGGGTKCPAL